MPGLIALAVAMGIGRFAFTPLLPMMQADAGVSVAQGGWLASANYLGYFVGALAALRMHWRPGAVIRLGLVLTALTTAWMAWTGNFWAWAVLRFAAGVASAWVLVFVSSWGFDRPAVVFCGVGTGIAATGLLALGLMAANADSGTAWLALGVVALVASLAAWPAFRDHEVARPDSGAAPFAWSAGAWRLVLCYGAFGFGYIIPATFIPVMAKQSIGDPALFGWSWPVFGLAAAASTLAAGRLRSLAGDRRIWIASQVVMAVGVSIPIVTASLTGTVVAALLVGGTFMVITMAGLQEGRRLAGAGARTLVAAMTSAFAAGQVAGPIVVGVAGSFTVSRAIAAAVLLAGAFILWRSP